jgi:hypothetical protein
VDILYPHVHGRPESIGLSNKYPIHPEIPPHHLAKPMSKLKNDTQQKKVVDMVGRTFCHGTPRNYEMPCFGNENDGGIKKGKKHIKCAIERMRMVKAVLCHSLLTIQK